MQQLYEEYIQKYVLDPNKNIDITDPKEPIEITKVE
jgi:hypothetical protein